jgi:hypothetical protein
MGGSKADYCWKSILDTKMNPQHLPSPSTVLKGRTENATSIPDRHLTDTIPTAYTVAHMYTYNCA